MRLIKRLLLVTAFFGAVINYNYHSTEWMRLVLMLSVAAYIMILLAEELRRPTGQMEINLSMTPKVGQLLVQLAEKAGIRVNDRIEVIRHALAIFEYLVSKCLLGQRVQVGDVVGGWEDVNLLEGLNGGPVDEVEGLD